MDKQPFFFIKTSYYSFPFKSLILHVLGLVFNTELIKNIFFWPFICVTFTRNILILRNLDSITNFKFRNFRICLNFSSQSKIIGMKRLFTNITFSSTNLFEWLRQDFLSSAASFCIDFYFQSSCKPLSNCWFTFIMSWVH